MAWYACPPWPLPLSWVWASPCWFGSPSAGELIGSVFGGTDYLLYLLFMGLALWLAILAAAAAYQFTRRS